MKIKLPLYNDSLHNQTASNNEKISSDEIY